METNLARQFAHSIAVTESLPFLRRGHTASLTSLVAVANLPHRLLDLGLGPLPVPLPVTARAVGHAPLLDGVAE